VEIPACANSAAVATKGQQLPFTPKFKANLTARYTWDMAGWTAHVQAAALYQGRNFPALRVADIQSLGVMPAYATADLSTGAEQGRTSIELFVKNLFDTHGQANRSTPCTISTCAMSSASNANPGTVFNFVYVTPIQPRIIGIRFGQKF
jgi:outer membrane receptor protein involved in Fe transport